MQPISSETQEMSNENSSQERVTRSGLSFLEFKKSCSTEEFPNKFSRYIMEKGSIYYWPQGSFHVITKSELAKQVLKSPEFSADRSLFFISRMPNLDLHLIKDFFALVQKMMVMSDGEAHARRRRAAMAGLEDHILDQFSKTLDKTIQILLSKAFQKKEFDFVADIAKKLPSTVLADLFSIPAEDREDFFHWSNIMTAFFGGASQYRNEDGVEVNTAAKSLRDYFGKLIHRRRMNPGNDYVSHLIRAQTRFSLDDSEIISQAVMMLVAGQVTTTDQICNIMYILASHPEVQLSLRESCQNLDAAIEEMKRFDPAVSFLFRVANTDTFVGGQPVKKGETLFISNHAVNRDTLKQGFKLDISRKDIPHFAYGHGPHYCLGAKLGRLQMNQLFSALLTQNPFVRLSSTQKTSRDHYSLAFSGFKSLHLEAVDE